MNEINHYNNGLQKIGKWYDVQVKKKLDTTKTQSEKWMGFDTHVRKRYRCEDRHTLAFLIACLRKVTELERSHKYFNICPPREWVIRFPRCTLRSYNHAVPHPVVRVPHWHELCNVKASRLFSQSTGKPHIGGGSRIGPTFVMFVWNLKNTWRVRSRRIKVQPQILKVGCYSRTYYSLFIYVFICLFIDGLSDDSISSSVYIPLNSLTE